eukprot:6197843-Pleurochrysis_carterae.AAC.1
MLRERCGGGEQRHGCIGETVRAWAERSLHAPCCAAHWGNTARRAAAHIITLRYRYLVRPRWMHESRIGARARGGATAAQRRHRATDTAAACVMTPHHQPQRTISEQLHSALDAVSYAQRARANV